MKERRDVDNYGTIEETDESRVTDSFNAMS